MNNCFARLGLLFGRIIATKLPSLIFKGNEFNFSPVTRRELKLLTKYHYKISWTRAYTILGIEKVKLSIETHLQFAIKCINANTFPDALKEAYVSPIYNRGDRRSPENDRPISVTPTLAKLFERPLLEQMSARLDMNKIINKNHFSFQKQKLCLKTIIALTEKINHYVEENDRVLTLFLDLAKIFNSISLHIISKKLRYMVREKTKILIDFVSN